MSTDDLKTAQLILDLKEMLRVYVDGKDHNETRGQALATIREANAWLYGEDK
jgi:hypothetical protein